MYALGIVLLLIGIIGLVATREAPDDKARLLCWWSGALGLIVLILAVVLDLSGSTLVD